MSKLRKATGDRNNTMGLPDSLDRSKWALSAHAVREREARNGKKVERKKDVPLQGAKAESVGEEGFTGNKAQEGVNDVEMVG